MRRRMLIPDRRVVKRHIIPQSKTKGEGDNAEDSRSQVNPCSLTSRRRHLHYGITLRLSKFAHQPFVLVDGIVRQRRMQNKWTVFELE